jgi:hypothetical protein
MDEKFIVKKPPSKSPITQVDDSDSILNFFDQSNPDIDFFNLVDDETIRISGSKIALYKYYPSQEFDDVYMESRSKAISKDPIILFAHYEPKAIEQSLSQFGLEVDNDQVFTFNKLYVERKIGRPIIVGDIIAPMFQNIKYKVYQVSEDSYEVYGVYHLMCYCNLLRDTEAIQNQPIMDRPNNLGKDINI